MSDEEASMRKILLTILFVAALTVLLPVGAGLGQKKQSQCEQAAQTNRNWELIGRDYVYFDYVLCPANMNPPSPLIRVWITTRGDGIAVEKWAEDGDRADVVSMFNGKKKAYTLYRDLNAIPLQVFKAEHRSGVAAETSKQLFLARGNNLIPLENLTPDSAERARRVFENADVIIRTAQIKGALLHDASRMAAIFESLNSPLKAQN
jgi:hypothetical protein